MHTKCSHQKKNIFFLLRDNSVIGKVAVIYVFNYCFPQPRRLPCRLPFQTILKMEKNLPHTKELFVLNYHSITSLLTEQQKKHDMERKLSSGLSFHGLSESTPQQMEVTNPCPDCPWTIKRVSDYDFLSSLASLHPTPVWIHRVSVSRLSVPSSLDTTVLILYLLTMCFFHSQPHIALQSHSQDFLKPLGPHPFP